MRFSKFALAVLSIAVLGVGSFALVVQEDDVRGAFLTSRPKEKPVNSGTATRPSRKRPKVTSSAPVKVVDTRPNPSGDSGTNKNSSGSKNPVNTPKLGLGLTLFMRDSNGLAVRADPARVFRKGDRVRVILETNADGYLYLFNTTNDGPPVMIYPDPQLDDGGNYIQAHVPFEIPASTSDEDRLRWFTFDEVAGDEKIFFVFTREPLKDVPLEDDLVAFCRNSTCPIKPAEALWAQIQSGLKTPLKTDRSKEFGNAETAAEQQANTRGLGLAKDDPQPSLIMMATSNSSTLVTSLALAHK